MLVGVDASDSVVETIRGQRLLATIFGLLFALTLVIGISQVSFGAMGGLAEANAAGNVQSPAKLLFSKYVFAFQATSALLLSQATRAIVRAHSQHPLSEGHT